jgi:hypothetical protein
MFFLYNLKSIAIKGFSSAPPPTPIVPYVISALDGYAGKMIRATRRAGVEADG